MQNTQFIELKEEIQGIFTGGKNIIDSILPPLLFVIINELVGFDAAMWSSLALAGGISILRIFQGKSIMSALGGVGGIGAAILLTKLFGSKESFFLPGIISNLFWAALFTVSMIAGKPLLAWGSYFLRKWPLEWYWHPKVRPAYMEVSLMWLAFMTARSSIQLILYTSQAVDELAILSLVTGAPATIILLAASFIYGGWRLKHLEGPSVQEFEAGISAPWKGQQRGF